MFDFFLTVLYYFGMVYTLVFGVVALVMALSFTELLPKKKWRRWYLCHLLFMVICVACFFYL